MSDTPEPTPAESATPASSVSAAEQLATLKAFVSEEIKRTKRGISLTYSLGILASAFVAGYMFFLLNFVNQTLDPRFLAALIASQTADAIPVIVDEAEKTLLLQAEVTAKRINEEFYRLVPAFSKAGRDYIDMTYQDAIPHLSEEFSGIIRDYFDANAVALKEFADSHNSEEFAAFFTESMMEELGQQLDLYLSIEIEGRSLDYFHDNLTFSLLAMDQALTELLDADPSSLTRRQQIQRQLIARLFHMAAQTGE